MQWNPWDQSLSSFIEAQRTRLVRRMLSTWLHGLSRMERDCMEVLLSKQRLSESKGNLMANSGYDKGGIPPDAYNAQRPGEVVKADNIISDNIKPGKLIANPTPLIFRKGPHIGDYDEFMRDCGREEIKSIEITGESIDSDMVTVTHMPTGRRYRIPAQMARDYNFKRTEFVQPPLEEEERIHITDKGSVLCGFSSLPPSEWPKGHFRISMDAWKQGAKISCRACMLKAPKSEL